MNWVLRHFNDTQLFRRQSCRRLKWMEAKRVCFRRCVLLFKWKSVGNWKHQTDAFQVKCIHIQRRCCCWWWWNVLWLYVVWVGSIVYALKWVAVVWSHWNNFVFQFQRAEIEGEREREILFEIPLKCVGSHHLPDPLGWLAVALKPECAMAMELNLYLPQLTQINLDECGILWCFGFHF